MINFIDAHLNEYQNDSPEIAREMLQTKLKLFFESRSYYKNETNQR